MTFVKSANLRSLLFKNECPSAIKHCHAFFEKLVDTDVRNMLLTDISIFGNLTHFLEPSMDLNEDMTDDTLSSASMYKALHVHLGQQSPLAKEAKTLHHFTRHGHTFSTFSRHKGNGSVIVYDRTLMSQIPARVEDIIQLPSNDVYFAVRKYLTRATGHPFEAYPALQTTLWQSELGSITIVHLDDVIGHFASVPFDWNGDNYLAVVSLCRVMLYYSLASIRTHLICSDSPPELSEWYVGPYPHGKFPNGTNAPTVGVLLPLVVVGAHTMLL